MTASISWSRGSAGDVGVTSAPCDAGGFLSHSSRSSFRSRSSATACNPVMQLDAITRVNQTRESLGRPPVRVTEELTVKAQALADHLASTGQLEHSADLAAGIAKPFSLVGENEGYGGSRRADPFAARRVTHALRDHDRPPLHRDRRRHHRRRPTAPSTRCRSTRRRERRRCAGAVTRIPVATHR